MGQVFPKMGTAVPKNESSKEKSNRKEYIRYAAQTPFPKMGKVKAFPKMGMCPKMGKAFPRIGKGKEGTWRIYM